jgi:methylated-DNA-[protein]-cysteine S-methyltransferase
MLTVTEEDGALTALVIDGQKYAERHLTGEGTERETPVLHRARLWLDAYFAGKAPEVSGLPLSPKGTAFQKKVWQELLNIPYGTTNTYGALAGRLGSSARAVGSAVGRNPISIIIPCHRVVGAGGSLTGYAGGIDKKRFLLTLESVGL